MPTTISNSFSRPGNTTTYDVNELVADSATGASVTPLEFHTGLVVGRGTIGRVRLFKSTTTASNASFVLYLFTASPTVTNGDNGAFSLTSSVLNCLGTVACDMSTGGVAGASAGLMKGFAITGGITFDLHHVGPGERRLYGLLSTAAASAAYAPGDAESFTVTLEITDGPH